MVNIVEKVIINALKKMFKPLAKIISKVDAGDVPKIILSFVFLKNALYVIGTSEKIPAIKNTKERIINKASLKPV